MVALVGQEVAYAAAQGYTAFQVFYLFGGQQPWRIMSKRWQGGMGEEVSSCWTCSH